MITMPRLKSIVALIALGTSILTATPAVAQSTSEAQSAASLSVVMEFLANTAPEQVEATTKMLVAPRAAYIHLSYDNPDFKKKLPLIGTNKGPEVFNYTSSQVAIHWSIEDFNVTDKIASGDFVSNIGDPIYSSKIPMLLPALSDSLARGQNPIRPI